MFKLPSPWGSVDVSFLPLKGIVEAVSGEDALVKASLKFPKLYRRIAVEETHERDPMDEVPKRLADSLQTA